MKVKQSLQTIRRMQPRTAGSLIVRTGIRAGVDGVDALELEYLEEQKEAINRLGDYVTNLNKVGQGLGEYLFGPSGFVKE